MVRAMAEKTRSRSPVRIPDEPARDEIPKADEEGKLLEGRTRETPKMDGMPETSLQKKVLGVSLSTPCCQQPGLWKLV